MLSSKQPQLGGGGCQESATDATGPGAPWDKRLGDEHRAGRCCGPPSRADGHAGLAGGLGPAQPAPLAATEAQWGGTAVIWLASIVTEGAHRKVSVETSLKGLHHTLSRLTAQGIAPLDVSDDRLSHLLTHLSKPTYGPQMEHDLKARSSEVYAFSQGVLRCEAPTVSGEHEGTAGGL
jgi:hypothetical protein